MQELNENFIDNINYCREQEIKKVIIFIRTEKNVILLKDYLDKEKLDIEVIAVTFPSNEKMYIVNDEDDVEEFIPPASEGTKVKNLLESKDIKLVSGSLPFEGIVIPGVNYNPYKIIEQTFNLVHQGLGNLIQALLMATDKGEVYPDERVVVMNNVLAIDVSGTNTRLLFHPKDGLKINNIIQKKQATNPE
ncbi:hypothetical protein NM897_09690 [Planococcus maritimus]|uniref:hypothetical protein n=1 Tax=Planococcus maritimus TaxID=192421 RepID=UPI003139C903